MSRRRPLEEVQFGSDSFLDVVANIVGILIILIVITGLRISENPAAFPTITQIDTPDSGGPNAMPAPSDMPDLEDAPESDTATETPKVVVLQPVDESEQEEEPEAYPKLPELTVPQELVALTDQLEAEIAEFKKIEAELGAQLKSSHEQQTSLLDRQQTIKDLMRDRLKDLKASKQRVAKSEADLELARETLVRLKLKADELEAAPVNVSSLEHRITPISREVNGREKHYRLEKNRVVEVPVDELIGHFREQIERRKDWLIKTRQHEGQIGPIRGFSMHYLVRVDSMSDLNSGNQGFRITLGRWEMRPEPETRGETEEVALRKGSQFYQSILGTGPDTTLTFWVYPDSYSIFRKLQKFAHEHGYSVAARPMLFGLQIAGSPDGTKSSSE